MRTRIDVYADIFRDNNELADAIYRRNKAAGVVMVNILGTPGSGKTSLIEALYGILAKAGRLKEKRPLVIEADVESDIDARRLGAQGIKAYTINTHGACHLDAPIVDTALRAIGNEPNLILIENIGNLICPADYYLGETKRLLVVSTTEGSDKPYKYPLAFRTSSAIIVNKIDLESVMGFDRDFFEKGVRAQSKDCPIFYLSATKGQGMNEVAQWLEGIEA